MASTFLCGSMKNKASRHQYNKSHNINKRKRSSQKHYRTSSVNNNGNKYYNKNNINTEHYDFNCNQNESSLSDLGDHDGIDPHDNDMDDEEEEDIQQQHIEQEDEEDENTQNSAQISIARSRGQSLSYNMVVNNHNSNINDFSLNYNGHISNHASPQHISDHASHASNPYQLILDQKKLHKVVKSVQYPYLSWHYFDDKFEPVIDVQRRKVDPGPVILRLDGKTYAKCIPCSRDNMDRELFSEETVLNIIKWSLRHFISYCAEYNHDCTFMKKARNYKTKLQQSIAQSKSLLCEKIKLQQQTDKLYHQLSNSIKKEQFNAMAMNNADLKTYKESSKHWKKECAKEKKNQQNTSRDFQELLKKSNTNTMQYNQSIKQQRNNINELQQTIKNLTNDKNQFYEKSVKLSKNKAELKQKIGEIQLQNDAFCAQIQTVKNKQIENVKNRQIEHDSEMNRYQTLAQKQEKAVKNLRNELKIKSNEFVELNEMYQALCKKHTNLQTEMQEMQENHENVNELKLKLDNSVNKLQRELQLKQENAEKYQAIETKLSNMQQIETQLSDTQQQNENLIQINNELQTEINEFKSKQEQHDQQITALNTQNKAAFALTMQHNLTKIKDLNHELDLKNEQLDELNEAETRCKQEMEIMRGERAKDIEALRNRFNANKSQQIQELNHKLNVELEKLAAENDAMCDELQHVENNNFELQHKNEQLQTELNTLRASYLSQTERESELQFAEMRKQKLKTESVQQQLAKVSKERNLLKAQKTNNNNSEILAAANNAVPDSNNNELDAFKQKYEALMTCYKHQKDELMQLKLEHHHLEELHNNNNLHNKKRQTSVSMTSSDGDLDINNSHSPPPISLPQFHRMLDDDMDDLDNNNMDTLAMDTPTAIELVNKRLLEEKKQSVILDRDNKLHPTWNLYDWYNAEQSLQVIDDILSGDAQDSAVQHFFDSLGDKHGYIHEAIINNEWHIWRYVQECKQIDNYSDAFTKLLDDHPRLYAAIHAEELLQQMQGLNEKLLMSEEEEYEGDDMSANDEEYKEIDGEFYNEYEHLVLVDVEEEEEEDVDGYVYDFQTHPEYAMSFVCDEIGKIKLFQTKKNDIHLMKCANMRYNAQQHDHSAYCCAISPLGEYVGFGGGYNEDRNGIVVCYKIVSKNDIDLLFVINDNNFKFEKDLVLGAIHCIEFDETGQLLFVGNNVGDVWLFDVTQNGKFIQNIGCKQNKRQIRDLCFYSDHIFILTANMCFAYYYNSENEHSLQINVESIQIITCSNGNNAFGHLGVASYGYDALIVYIASNVLQYHILAMQASNNQIIIPDENENENENKEESKEEEEIRSLCIDHKNEYVLISRKKSIKSYKIGNGINDGPLKTMDRSSCIAKCAVNYKNAKYVAICYEKPCSIEIKKFVKK